MSVLPQRGMLMAHSVVMTSLLFFLSSADWNLHQYASQDHLRETNDLAEIIRSPELHDRLPRV